jgi:hypothetical protein
MKKRIIRLMPAQSQSPLWDGDMNIVQFQKLYLSGPLRDALEEWNTAYQNSTSLFDKKTELSNFILNGEKLAIKLSKFLGPDFQVIYYDISKMNNVEVQSLGGWH